MPPGKVPLGRPIIAQRFIAGLFSDALAGQTDLRRYTFFASFEWLQYLRTYSWSCFGGAELHAYPQPRHAKPSAPGHGLNLLT